MDFDKTLEALSKTAEAVTEGGPVQELILEWMGKLRAAKQPHENTVVELQPKAQELEQDAQKLLQALKLMKLSNPWPTADDPCYNCGSTIPGHHTFTCDFAGPGDKRDLPQVDGFQYWTKELPPDFEL